MICFRDMTYCTANCATVSCHRHKVNEAKDRKWSGSKLDFLPTAWSDFSNGCPEYKPVVIKAIK